MSAKQDSLRVGFVTIVVVLIFFATLLWISRGVGGDMKTITVRFAGEPSMPALAPGSDVLVGGQKVGRISGATLREEKVRDESGDPVTRAYVYIDAEVLDALVLRADCAVFAEGPPLGGNGILKIDLGTDEAPLAPDAVIEGAPPLGFAAILASMQGELDGADPHSLLGRIKAQLDPEGEMSLMAKLLRSLDDVNAMTASLSTELQPEEKASILAKVHGIMDNFNVMTAALRDEMDLDHRDAMLRKFHRAMDSANEGLAAMTRLLTTTEPMLTQSVANVERTTANLANETDASRPGSLIAHLHKTSEQLNATLDDINEITSTTRDVVVLNRENLNRLLINFKESSDHLKNGLKFVLMHPWRLLNEPTQKETRQQAIFDAARSFAEAATRLDDTAAQLRALAELHGGTLPADTPELARIEADLRETRQKYLEAEKVLWNQLALN